MTSHKNIFVLSSVNKDATARTGVKNNPSSYSNVKNLKNIVFIISTF